MLVPILFGAVACGVPLTAAELTATAVNGGNVSLSPTPETHVLASSILAPIALDASAGAPGTPVPPAGTPGANTTPVGTAAPNSTPSASVTRAPGTPTPGAGSPTPASGTATPGPTATGTPATPTPAQATATPAASPASLSSASSQQSVSAAGDPASQAFKLVNDYRATKGLSPLRSNGSLTADAAGYAKYLGDQNYFAHDGLDGSSPSSRMTAAGYKGRFKGEALAAGQSSADGALNTWLGSPAHAAIVLDSSAVDVGIGYYNKPGSSYTNYWVLVTGVP